jgi:hypothetical protein
MNAHLHAQTDNSERVLPYKGPPFLLRQNKTPEIANWTVCEYVPGLCGENIMTNHMPNTDDQNCFSRRPDHVNAFIIPGSEHLNLLGCSHTTRTTGSSQRALVGLPMAIEHFLPVTNEQIRTTSSTQQA